MKTIFYSLLTLTCLILTSSCFPVIAPGNVAAGRAVFIGTKEGVSSSQNNVEYKKFGKACVTNIIYLVSFGDASIQAAKNNGGITKVSHIEMKKDGFGFIFLFLPFIYNQSCTFIYGE